MATREQALEHEIEQLRQIIRDTHEMVLNMYAEDQEPQTRGWSASIQGVAMCEVPGLLKRWDGFTPHEGGPGIVGPAELNTAQ